MLKQPVELGVDLVCDGGEIFGAILEIQAVGIDRENLARVFGNPFFVPFVQAFEIVQFNALFILSATLLNLRHQMRNRRTQINKEIRGLYQRHPCMYRSHGQ